VGFLFQSALGSSASDFHVIQILDHVFRFSVSYREVGFLINHLQFYKCDSFTVFFHLWNNGGPNWRKGVSGIWEKEFQEFEKDEEASWHAISCKKISYVEAAKKPPLIEANSTPLQNKKEWRPRITVFDKLGKSATGIHQVSSKKIVFHRLGYSNGSANNSLIGTLIPRKSVFDRMDFDLGRAGNVKNLGFKQIQTFDRSSSGFNSIDSEARNPQPFQSSNFKKAQVSNRFCIRCLRLGH
jgi:hypothetical protein